MCDFYAKQGEFAPMKAQPDSVKELTDKFNQQAKQLEELMKTVAEQKKTVDTLTKNPSDSPKAS